MSSYTPSGAESAGRDEVHNSISEIQRTGQLSGSYFMGEGEGKAMSFSPRPGAERRPATRPRAGKERRKDRLRL